MQTDIIVCIVFYLHISEFQKYKYEIHFLFDMYDFLFNKSQAQKQQIQFSFGQGFNGTCVIARIW